VKHLLVALSVAVAAVSLGLAPSDADAKRLGGGKAAGMQRQAPPPSSTPNSTPPTTANAPAAAAAPAAATTGAAAAAAAAPKRNWMGPLAGLAAGLGIAALFSHLGMGEGLANFMMLALLAVAAFFVIRFLLARFAGGAARRPAGPQLAGAGAPMGGWQAQQPAPAEPALQRSALQQVTPTTATAASPLPAAAPATLPGGMATADFERLAKMVFIRMQAANDAGNVDDLRKFTTPELFASLRLDLQDRGDLKQQTDVVQIDAQVVEVAQEKGQDIVSVRFHGLIREAADAGAEPFNELWHLVRPADGQGEWAIAGITPVQ
jgi:predicted lipid-binding transport protein (Tim44 family)